MPKFTATTIVKEQALLIELEKVRTQGYALDNTENEPDGRCIAAPIFDPDNKVFAALSVSGPLPRMTMTRAKGLLKELTHTCTVISQATF
jgi:DNA-binding IclR family transcriptional regulator